MSYHAVQTFNKLYALLIVKKLINRSLYIIAKINFFCHVTEKCFRLISEITYFGKIDNIATI